MLLHHFVVLLLARLSICSAGFKSRTTTQGQLITPVPLDYSSAKFDFLNFASMVHGASYGSNTVPSTHENLIDTLKQYNFVNSELPDLNQLRYSVEEEFKRFHSRLSSTVDGTLNSCQDTPRLLGLNIDDRGIIERLKTFITLSDTATPFNKRVQATFLSHNQKFLVELSRSAPEAAQIEKVLLMALSSSASRMEKLLEGSLSTCGDDSSKKQPFCQDMSRSLRAFLDSVKSIWTLRERYLKLIEWISEVKSNLEHTLDRVESAEARGRVDKADLLHITRAWISRVEQFRKI